MAENLSREKLGSKLKSIRERTGKTQEEVSEILGIPRSAVSLIESGDRGLKVEELEEYAKIFRTKLDSLISKPTVKAMSENRTNAGAQKFYPSIAEITEDLKAMGVQEDKLEVSTTTLAALKNINLCKAHISFHMNVTEADIKQAMVDWVDEIAATYPAAKPALQINQDDKFGFNKLSFMVAL